MFASYLSVLAKLMTKAPRNEMYKLLNSIFLKNESWKETVRVFANRLFSEIFSFCSEEYAQHSFWQTTPSPNPLHMQPGSSSNQAGNTRVSDEIIELFSCGQKALEYWKAALVMC